jgi:hypothetical protein
VTRSLVFSLAESILAPMEQASTVSESRPRRVARLAVMRAFAFLRRIPFREVVASVAVLLFMGENYPFSNFPMYAALSGEATILFFTDAKDNVMAFHADLATSSDEVRKILRSKRKAAKRAALAGGETATGERIDKQATAALLTQLLGSLEKVFPARREEIRRNGLRLYEIRYRKTPDGMETDKRMLAEIAPEM